MSDQLNSKDIEPLEKNCLPGMPWLWMEICLIAFGRLINNKTDLSSKDGIAQAAVNISADIGQELGGHMYYTPKGRQAKSAIKTDFVYKKFNGRNHKEIAHGLGITGSRVRQILKRQEASQVNL